MCTLKKTMVDRYSLGHSACGSKFKVTTQLSGLHHRPNPAQSPEPKALCPPFLFKQQRQQDDRYIFPLTFGLTAPQPEVPKQSRSERLKPEETPQHEGEENSQTSWIK